jgi:hypothetical protein
VIVFGKWRGQPSGRVTVRGETGAGAYARVIDLDTVKPLEANAALRYLWARHRIAALADFNRLCPGGDTVKEVTRLGLAYNLLTEFTSFVAVDTVVRANDGKVETVTQPLPLPQGVSDLAVGGSAMMALAAPARTYTRSVGGIAGGAADGVPGSVAYSAPPPPARSVSEQDSASLRLAWRSTPESGLVKGEATANDALRRAWASLRRVVLGWRFPASPRASTITVRLRRISDVASVVGVVSVGPLSSADAERVVKAALAQRTAVLEHAVSAGVEVVMAFSVRPDGTVDRVEFATNPK